MMYCWARRRSACTPASVSASGVGTQLMVGLRLLRPARRRDRRSNSTCAAALWYRSLLSEFKPANLEYERRSDVFV